MDNKKVEWLPHLEGSIPEDVQRYTLSLYCISLEAWRRGITLTFISSKRNKGNTLYKLSYKGKEHIFSVSRGDLVPRGAIQICLKKHTTKKHLLKAGVSTPEGADFSKESSDTELIKYANTLGYPVVLKPIDGASGHGVIANIEDEGEFRQALQYVRHELNYPELIVEKHFTGQDYRIYVIDNKVVGAVSRIPANVIGNGKNTVKELIEIKKKIRNKNPALSNSTIKSDQEMKNMLSEIGYTLSSVPKEGERVFLKSKNNISAGGDPVDVTDELTPKIKEVAIEATKSIPGLVQAGVDVMVNKDKGTGVVLEINSRPSIRAHLFPMEGKARDVPKAIIDYYFPETKESYKNISYYYEFQDVYELLQSGVVKEVSIPDIPKGSVSATRFIITGNFRKRSYAKWVQKQAVNLDLHGSIRFLTNSRCSIVISGSTKSVGEFRKVIKSESPRKTRVRKVVEKSRKSPVKIGFEIVQFEESDGFNSIKREERREREKTEFVLKKDYKKKLKESEYYKGKYQSIKDSKSWAITKPIRVISKVVGNSLRNKSDKK